MKYIFTLFIVFLFVSCSNNSKDTVPENQTLTDTLAIDTLAVQAFSFDEKEFKVLKLPFVIDTLFIQTVDTNHRLTYQQVRQLGINGIKGEVSDLHYSFNQMCMIDSLKQINKYQEYVNKLDIGMMEKSIVFKVGVLDVGNNNRLFIWGTIYSSYPACPFYSGTELIGTLVTNDKQNIHISLAKIAGGGDPPSMGNTETTCKINTDGTIEINTIEENDDLDVPGINHTYITQKLKIEEDKIVEVSNKKEEKNTEKEISN